MRRDLAAVLDGIPRRWGFRGIKVNYSDLKTGDLNGKGIYLKGHSDSALTSAELVKEYCSLKKLHKASKKFVAEPYALVYGGFNLDKKVHGYLMQFVSGKSILTYLIGVSEALNYSLPKMTGTPYFFEADKMRNGLIAVKTQLIEFKSDIERAGVEHGDLHSGNILIREGDNRLLVVDPLPLTRNYEEKTNRKQYDIECINEHLEDIENYIEKIDLATRLRRLVGAKL